MPELEQVGDLEVGRVAWYKIQKQYGFISRANGEELFFHHASIVFVGNGSCNHSRAICARAVGLTPPEKNIAADTPPKLIERAMIGTRVQFRIVTTDKGLEARSVRRV